MRCPFETLAGMLADKSYRESKGDDYIWYSSVTAWKCNRAARNIAFALGCVACIAACDAGPYGHERMPSKYSFFWDDAFEPGKRALSNAGLWTVRGAP